MQENNHENYLLLARDAAASSLVSAFSFYPTSSAAIRAGTCAKRKGGRRTTSSKQNLYLDWKQEVTHKKKKKGKRIQATKQRAGKNPNTKSKPVTHTHTDVKQEVIQDHHQRQAGEERALRPGERGTGESHQQSMKVGEKRFKEGTEY